MGHWRDLDFALEHVEATLDIGQALVAQHHLDRAESLRVFRSCPLITPKDAQSSLQMLAIAH